MQKPYRERKKNRLPFYDYKQAGWYFVTICIRNKTELFGKIEKEKMMLNDLGVAADNCWQAIPEHFPNVLLDEYIVMPNHVHGIIVINNSIISVGNKNICSENMTDNSAGNKNICSENMTDNSAGNKNICSLRDEPWQTKLSGSLSSIVRGFKIGVTKWCRENRREQIFLFPATANTFPMDEFQWQKSFYDHIIRNEKSLNNIRQYILNNPSKWELDRNNQENLYY